MAVSAALTGLAPGTTYYYEVVAINGGGTTDGTILSFKTAPTPTPPVATTQPATAITTTGGTLNASANPEGSATTVEFVYGTSPTLTIGTMTSATQSSGDGTSPVSVSAGLNNLTPGTTYYYRAVALTAGGITDGTILSFTTVPSPTSTPTPPPTFADSINLAELPAASAPPGGPTRLYFDLLGSFLGREGKALGKFGKTHKGIADEKPVMAAITTVKSDLHHLAKSLTKVAKWKGRTHTLRGDATFDATSLSLLDRYLVNTVLEQGPGPFQVASAADLTEAPRAARSPGMRGLAAIPADEDGEAWVATSRVHAASSTRTRNPAHQGFDEAASGFTRAGEIAGATGSAGAAAAAADAATLATAEGQLLAYGVNNARSLDTTGTLQTSQLANSSSANSVIDQLESDAVNKLNGSSIGKQILKLGAGLANLNNHIDSYFAQVAHNLVKLTSPTPTPSPTPSPTPTASGSFTGKYTNFSWDLGPYIAASPASGTATLTITGESQPPGQDAIVTGTITFSNVPGVGPMTLQFTASLPADNGAFFGYFSSSNPYVVPGGFNCVMTLEQNGSVITGIAFFSIQGSSFTVDEIPFLYGSGTL